MSLPDISVIFRRTDATPNPQELDAIACVLGPCSTGSLTDVVTLGSLAACAQMGNGPGVELAAAIGLRAGWPVYLKRVPADRQAPGAVTKTSASAGVPKLIYGSALAPGGTPPAGGVLYTAKTSGVSVVQVSGGSNGVVVSGSPGAQVVTVTYATAATNTTIASLVNGTPAAFALLSASPVGGSGAVGPLTSTLLDNGSLTATPLSAGVTLTIVYSGTSTPLGIPAVVGSAVVINGATTADGLPASTPAQIKTFFDTDAGAGAVAARALLALTAGGTGAGLASAAASTALQYGSTAALSASGTGTDVFNFVIESLVDATVGGTPSPAFRWSADKGITFSSKLLIPATGIVALADQVLDTGIVVTFTGALQVGDRWTFSVAEPVVAPSDLLASADVAIADMTRRFGYLTASTYNSRTTGQQLDQRIQAVKTIRFLRALINALPQTTGESEAAWANRLIAEWAGLQSADGPLWVAASGCSHISGYTGRVYPRPFVFPVAARRSSQAVHQSLGETASGALPDLFYGVDSTSGIVTDPGITHNERKLPGLSEARFIVPRTYAQRSDGEVYITDWPTMSEPSDVAHATGMYVNVLFEAARIAAEAAFPLIQKPAEGIAVAESATVPAGAISKADAARIESLVGGAVDAFLFRPKTDNLPSASRLNPPDRTITVLRNNKYITDKRLYLELRVLPLGYNRAIQIGVTLILP